MLNAIDTCLRLKFVLCVDLTLNVVNSQRLVLKLFGILKSIKNVNKMHIKGQIFNVSHVSDICLSIKETHLNLSQNYYSPQKVVLYLYCVMSFTKLIVVKIY